MKKPIIILSIIVLFGSVASADFVRIEMGAGGWGETPSGYISRTDSDGSLSLRGTYTSAEKEKTQTYLWAFFKHPIPLFPNIRIEYAGLKDEGTLSGSAKVGDTTLSAQGGYATIATDQYDFIPYYNILDNLVWFTMDVGIDIRYIKAKADVVDNASGNSVYSGDEDTLLPLAYLRSRIELPGTDIGIESDIKYMTYDDKTTYDFRAKADYTFDITPIVQAGIEVGYKIQKYELTDGNNRIDLKYKGVYTGIMLRF